MTFSETFVQDYAAGLAAGGEVSCFFYTRVGSYRSVYAFTGAPEALDQCLARIASIAGVEVDVLTEAEARTLFYVGRPHLSRAGEDFVVFCNRLPDGDAPLA